MKAGRVCYRNVPCSSLPKKGRSQILTQGPKSLVAEQEIETSSHAGECPQEAATVQRKRDNRKRPSRGPEVSGEASSNSLAWKALYSVFSTNTSCLTSCHLPLQHPSLLGPMHTELCTSPKCTVTVIIFMTPLMLAPMLRMLFTHSLHLEKNSPLFSSFGKGT